MDIGVTYPAKAREERCVQWSRNWNTSGLTSLQNVNKFGFGYSKGKSEVGEGNNAYGTWRRYSTTMYCIGINTEVIDRSLLNNGLL